MKNNDDPRLLARKQAFDERRKQKAIMAQRARRARTAQTMARIANTRRAS